ncbi:MAG: DegV family protein [Anaerolineae bacterium]|nr:DegV family protein [Anaerolineae bacterium]
MKIVTDSAADLPAEEAQRLGIVVVPLFIQFPDQEIGSTDLSADEFYDRLRAMAPDIPTTAQPAPGIFADIYRVLSKDGNAVMSIHISHGLSGTIQAARLGAQQVPEANITTVDCMTLSGGQRYQVLAAHAAAKAGWPLPDILALLDRVRASTETIFTLETIDYLARGGRIGRVQAIAGTLLRIKPIILVDKADGKYSSPGRGRTLQQTTGMIIEHLVQLYGTQRQLWVTVMQGQIPDKAQAFADVLRGTLNVGRLEILRVSPALGVHVGPGVVGAAVVPFDVLDGLDVTGA